jgi:ferritin-like metal-binding protein YciE
MFEDSSTLRTVFVTGLNNAHALENQALSLMDRQIERLEQYPEMEAMLRQHRVETEGQIARLEEILASLGETHSALKDAALSFSGNMAAIGHSFSGDEVIKNSFANYAFENFEIASYTGLITMAEDGFQSSVSALQMTLGEEQRMADWVREHIPATTRRYIALREEGLQASH